MKTHKRRKQSRNRGLTTYGKGCRQGERGSGSKGGKGMSGSGKRASQKVQFAQRLAARYGAKSYFGRAGFTSRSTAKEKKDVMNLEQIQKDFDTSKKIDLKNYKILGDGSGFKGTIIAKSASKSAIEKMEKAGGKIEVEEEEKEKVVVEKKEVLAKEGKKK
jgi:large subunit ribosomal protein L15